MYEQFLDNIHTGKYFKIIEIAKSKGRLRSDDAYYERHHILPVSMGGDANSENLIFLTPVEHFHVHELLPFMTEGRARHKMLYAWNMMSITRGSDKRITADEYHRLRNEYSKMHAQNMSTLWSGDANPTRGTTLSDDHRLKLKESHKGMSGRKHSIETKLKMKESQKATPHPSRGPQRKVTCPNCFKVGGFSAMHRWHFDNCKVFLVVPHSI